MTQNPFQQNIDIIKGFFRKPVILVAAILGFACFIFDEVFSATGFSSHILEKILDDSLSGYDLSAYGIFPGNDTGSMPSLNLLGLLLAVTFLLFYIMSKKPNSKLAAPSVMLRVAAIIQLVFVCIALAAAIFLIVALLIVLASHANNIQGAVSIVLIAVASVIVLIVGGFMLMLSISQVRYANSIRKSLTSIYLSANGATLFGIMYIIATAFQAIGLFASLPMIIAGQNPAVTAIYILSSVTSVAFNIVYAVIAIQYGSYIRNIAKRFVTSPQASQEIPQPAAPVQNIQQPPIQEFIPDMPAPPEVPQAPTIQQNNAEPAPVQNADTPQAPQAIFCANCGQQLNPDDYFCNNCGTPVQHQ